MNSPKKHRIILFICLLLALSLSCQVFGTEQPVLETPPAPDTSPLPTVAPPVEAPPGEAGPEEPSPTIPPESAATQVQPEQPAKIDSGACKKDACIRRGSFLLERPIGPDGRNTIVAASRFGEYQQATKDAQTGVYFLNSTGTPVLAAADGKVVVAGDDSVTPYGPMLGMYGNLVILEHSLPELTKPLYTLYGHLSEVSVGEGDPVTVGQTIGLVGSSGGAGGSTLLFEVRLGKNNPDQVRNPELWLKPLKGDKDKELGAIAGRILDADGEYLHITHIVVEQLAGPGMPAIDRFYLQTYSATRLRGLSPWEESFAIGDLPAGDYQISFMLEDIIRQQVVTVRPGKLTLATITVE